jgi:hypothetical protein
MLNRYPQLPRQLMPDDSNPDPIQTNPEIQQDSIFIVDQGFYLKDETRRGLFATIVLLSIVPPVWGTADSSSTKQNWLITPEEASASQAALRSTAIPLEGTGLAQPKSPISALVESDTKTGMKPGAPRLVILLPKITAPVTSPTPIQIRFEPVAPAAIRPETFKVRYGAFRIDITSRITAAARITPQGIDVAQATLPGGLHRLWIEIADSEGRIGSRQVDFSVE